MLVATDQIRMVKFTHDIHEDAKHAFDDLHAEIGGKKYELAEAMIYAFRALPEDLQLKLISSRPRDREPGIAFLRSLQWPPVAEDAFRPDSDDALTRIIESISPEAQRLMSPDEQKVFAALRHELTTKLDAVRQLLRRVGVQTAEAGRKADRGKNASAG